jgi:hypothetical protein
VPFDVDSIKKLKSFNFSFNLTFVIAFSSSAVGFLLHRCLLFFSIQPLQNLLCAIKVWNIHFTLIIIFMNLPQRYKKIFSHINFLSSFHFSYDISHNKLHWLQLGLLIPLKSLQTSSSSSLLDIFHHYKYDVNIKREMFSLIRQ